MEPGSTDVRWLKQIVHGDQCCEVAVREGNSRDRPDERPGSLPADVWIVDPNELQEPLDNLLSCLDCDERRRAIAKRTVASHRLFIVAHAGLRHVLASYLATTPAAVEFSNAPRGSKPVLHPAMGREIQFSLSHTHGLAVVAVAPHQAVGVDVEWTGRRSDLMGLTRRYLTATEQRDLQTIDPNLRIRRLLAYWTRREAVAKVTGKGLAHVLERPQIEHGLPVDPDISIYDLELRSDHVGALAIASLRLPDE